MQFDFGTIRTDIEAVRITARSDDNLPNSQDLSLYLSPTTTFSGSNGVLCVSGLRFKSLGETTTVNCPTSTAARYLTVMKIGTGQLNVQEIAALVTSLGRMCMRIPFPSGTGRHIC